MKNKILLDIKYYASSQSDKNDFYGPSDCSNFFPYSNHFCYWGKRIALRLKAFGLSVGSFDHVYINFTDMIPAEHVKISDIVLEDWFRYIDFGVDFETLNNFNEQELESFIINSTFKTLLYLVKNDVDKCKLINETAFNINTYSSEIEIPVKTKRTKSYTIDICFKLLPNLSNSYGIIKYKNHKSDHSFTKKFIELIAYKDIFLLTGTIVIKNGTIIIKPRNSSRAEYYMSNYKTPIKIEIEKNIKP